ncbi:MAG: hypothetical protein AAGK05_16230, partial [Pseudomonadota bacterium]
LALFLRRNLSLNYIIMAVRGAYRKTSLDIRQKLIDAAENGDDFVQLAQMLNIPKTTAYSIVRRGVATYSHFQRSIHIGVGL